jgi:hypothetical protein
LESLHTLTTHASCPTTKTSRHHHQVLLWLLLWWLEEEGLLHQHRLQAAVCRSRPCRTSIGSVALLVKYARRELACRLDATHTRTSHTLLLLLLLIQQLLLLLLIQQLLLLLLMQQLPRSAVVQLLLHALPVGNSSLPAHRETVAPCQLPGCERLLLLLLLNVDHATLLLPLLLLLHAQHCMHSKPCWCATSTARTDHETRGAAASRLCTHCTTKAQPCTTCGLLLLHWLPLAECTKRPCVLQGLGAGIG